MGRPSRLPPTGPRRYDAPVIQHEPREPGPWRDLALLAGLALAVRLVFLWLLDPVLDAPDAVLYCETALRLAAGDWLGYDPKIPLLYPLAGALFHLAIPDVERACRAVSFVASIATVLPLYGLARDLHGRAAARIACFIFAIWPWMVDYACRVGTEALACLLWIAAVWLLSRGLRRGGAAVYGAAAAFFALALTRPEGVVIWLAAFPAGALLAWGDRAGLRRLFPFGAATALGLGLITLHARLLTGQATPSYRAGFLLGEFDAARFAQTLATATTDLVPIMLGPVLLLFLGAGFFLPRAQRDLRLEGFALFFCLPQWAASVAVLSASPRYLMAPLLLLATWSAAGMALTRAMAVGHRWAVPLRALPLAALVATMGLGAAVTLGAEHTGRQPRQPREYKMAGQWMRAHLEPGMVFTRKPQVAYYAGMPSTGPADSDTLDEALERARAAGARYVVVDERYTPPGLRPLLDPAAAPPGLAPLHAIAPYPASRVVVYRLDAVEP